LKSKPSLPVGLCVEESADVSSKQFGSVTVVESLSSDSLSKAAKKNLKRKEKKKQQKSNDVDDAAEKLGKVSLQSNPENNVQVGQESSDDRKQDLARQVRALRKKLKQVVELQSKLDSGVKLESEQLAKLERRKAIEDEIEDLELELEDL